MRRRRQKNTLLPKMLGIAVLVNAILLPILAQLGVFKAVTGQHLTPVELVQAPPPPPKPKARANKPHVAHKTQTAHRAAPRPSEAARPSGPKVRVVATPSAGNAGSGQGSSGITTSEGPTGGPPAPTPTPTPAPTPAPAPAPTPTPAPAPTPTPAPVPAPAPAPPPPHVPALVPASVDHREDPQLPSDFSDGNLPASFRAVFHVHADGTATVEQAAGTGDATLDRLALDAARRWTFRPATEDGRPVDSYLRLTVNFVQSDQG